MYEFEDYYEPSEYDLLIDETLQKIKQGILNEAKSDIESRTKEVENLKLQISAQQETIKNLRSEISKRDAQISKLSTDLEKKISAFPHTKFELGDEVYVVRKCDANRITCPTCHGTGKINVETIDHREVDAICPDCAAMFSHNRKYRQYVEFYEYRVTKSIITEQIINVLENEIEIYYLTDNISGRVSEEDVFMTIEEATQHKDLLNKKEIEKAQLKLKNLD